MVCEVSNKEKFNLGKISEEKFLNNLTYWENTGFPSDIKKNALFYKNKRLYSKSIKKQTSLNLKIGTTVFFSNSNTI